MIKMVKGWGGGWLRKSATFLCAFSHFSHRTRYYEGNLFIISSILTITILTFNFFAKAIWYLHLLSLPPPAADVHAFFLSYPLLRSCPFFIYVTPLVNLTSGFTIPVYVLTSTYFAYADHLVRCSLCGVSGCLQCHPCQKH